MEQYLRIFRGKQQHDWADWLTCAEFSINNKINSSTGYSPFFLNYSQRPLLPVWKSSSGVPKADEFTKQMAALTKETLAALNLMSASMKRSYDKHHQDASPFPIGSLVLLDGRGINTNTPSRKLNDRWHGPFEVLEHIGDVSYWLKLPSSWRLHDFFTFPSLFPLDPLPSLPNSPPLNFKLPPSRQRMPSTSSASCYIRNSTTKSFI